MNLGRGSIVKESDLAIAINENEIAAAGLDVYAVEPLPSDSPLLTIRDKNRLLMTPHIAWTSVEARMRMVEEIEKNIQSWISGSKRNRII